MLCSGGAKGYGFGKSLKLFFLLTYISLLSSMKANVIITGNVCYEKIFHLLFDLCHFLLHILVPHQSDGIGNCQSVEEGLKEKHCV